MLTKVFIDKTDLVFEYENYQHRFIGNYTYDKANQQIVVIWHYPANMHDTLFAKILPGTKPTMKIFAGRIGRKAFTLNLLKVNSGDRFW